jgi:hypothetical protein
MSYALIAERPMVGSFINIKTSDPKYTADLAYRTAGLKWSGVGDIPQVGTRVYVAMNGWGWGTVTGYFKDGREGCEWIGLLIKPEVNPSWRVSKGNPLPDKIHIFGAELGEPKASTTR